MSSCYNAKVIIDFHTHIVSPKIVARRDELIRTDACFRALFTNPSAVLATAENIIDSMDGDGIDISVVLNMGWSSHELCCEINDYIMESVSRYPDRLIGFGSIHPESKDAVKEIEQCAKGGMRGIGEMMPHLQNFDLANFDLMAPIAETIEKLDLIFLVHCTEPVGHIYPGKGDVFPQTVYQFISNFPNMKVVCGHWGGGLPFYSLMPEVAGVLNNTYFDSAASPLLYRPDIFNIVSQIVGPGKILFGSDFPLIKQNRIVKMLDAMDIEAEHRKDILGNTARRLLGLK